MKKIITTCLTLLLLLQPGLWGAQGPVAAQAQDTQRISQAAKSPVQLKGAINGNLPIHMSIKVEAGGKLTGSYSYDKYKQTIRLTGNVSNNQATFSEYDAKGKETGHFEGWWLPATGFVGVWINADGSKQLPVEALTAAAANLKAPTAADWSGEWNVANSTPFRASTLEISKVKKDKLTFSMDAYDGAHSGTIEEEAAILRKRTAIYKEEDGSVVFLYLLGSKLYVTSPTPVYSAGANVTYTGQYNKGPAKVSSYTLKDLGVFETAAQDKAFRKVVGGDHDYELFLSSMQLLSKYKDQEGLQAKVVEGGVRGLFTISEAIIMYDAKGHYWAAVIGSEDPDNEEVGIPQVQFYTNVPGTTELPATIDAWRERFAEYKVVFMNE